MTRDGLPGTTLRAPQWQLDGRDPDWFDDEFAPAQLGVEERFGTAEYPAPPRVEQQFCKRCNWGLEADSSCWRCDLGCRLCGGQLDRDCFCSACGVVTLRRDDVRKAAA